MEPVVASAREGWRGAGRVDLAGQARGGERAIPARGYYEQEPGSGWCPFSEVSSWATRGILEVMNKRAGW